MLNPLKFLRYFVFVVFVICNAIITSVAVWNLSTVQSSPEAVGVTQIDAYLIFTGALGLLLIFPIIFCELCANNVFLVRVWFELLWVGAFWVMQLSTHLLGLLPSYVGLSEHLRLLSLLGGKIQHSNLFFSTRLFHILIHADYSQAEGRPYNMAVVPTTPSMPRFRAQSPPVIIAAPMPRRTIQLRDDILNHRSGLSLEYEIEPYQPPEPLTRGGPTLDGHRSPSTDSPSPPPLQPFRFGSQQQPAATVYDTPFYNSAVRTFTDKDASHPQPPPAVRLASIRRLPPSPPPLGDWPRLDATSRPPGAVSTAAAASGIRIFIPTPNTDTSDTSAAASYLRLAAAIAIAGTPPAPQPPPPVAAYTFDAPALAAALQPLAASSSSGPGWRSSKSKPSGPRRRSTSIDDVLCFFPLPMNYRSDAACIFN
ncbi:hypothetical protein BJ912DRAFT_946079 [Pholiota molesta]|nr:hypothetical protein BJ912DRAFT_946079 [Pholiota molesta]